MRFTTRTEYGLNCLIHMAKHQSIDLVTIKDVVREEQYSETYTEKIFQSLRAANIVASQQGKQGGYLLARKPSKITLREIIDTLEGATFDVFCEPKVRESIVCTHFTACGLRPVWQKTKSVLDDFFDSLTLEMIAKNESEVQNSVSK